MKHKSSWKQKIDPAFDKIIKKFIQLFDLTEFPANSGWLILEDEYFQKFNKKFLHGWIVSYEKEMTKQRIIDFSGIGKMTREEIKKGKVDFEKELFDEIRILPEDSQEYYKKIFEPYYSETVGLAYFKDMTPEERKEELKAFFSNFFFLGVHVGLIETENDIKNMDEKTLHREYLRPSVIMKFLLSLYNSICLLVFNISLPELLKDARNEDKESFFKILQIDRTAVECEWAKKMIRKAQLTADEEFFRKMGKAITTPPLENRKIYGRILVILLLFWQFGLWRLENEEIIELLEDSGIRVQDDQETFRKFVAREVKPAFERFKSPPNILRM
jgi:hypothetical protein